MPAITGNPGPVATSGFSPTAVGGCQMWLDAADSTTITQGSGTVTQWSDKSGSGNNAVPYSTGPQLIANVQNSLPGLLFSGGNTMKCGAFLTSTSSSVFIVTKYDSGRIAFAVWKVQYGSYVIVGELVKVGVNNTSGYGVDASISILDYTTTHIWAITLSSSSTANSPFTFNGSRDGNNTLITGTSSIGNATTCEQEVSIGGLIESGLAYYGITGYIHEVIVYNKELNTTQRQNVEGYLAQKWGLAANLPGGHPGLTTNYLSVIPRVFKIGPLTGTHAPFYVTANQPGTAQPAYTLTVAPAARYSLLTNPSGTIANTGSSGAIGAATIVNTSYTATAPSYASFTRVGINQNGGYILAPSITGIQTLVLIVRVTNTTPPAYFLDTRTGLGAGYLYSSSGSDHIGPDWTSATYYRDTVNTTFTGNFIAALQDGAWHHVCLQRASFTSAITFLARYSLTETLGCDCGEVMIFTGALTAQQVKDNYNFFSSRFGWTAV